jgi:XTP/dITP diphosphohydrolase
LEKAAFVYEKTGQWALADDSGLLVDALSGRPGVFSKRYSPEGTDSANNALLLKELLNASIRTARYACVLALVGPKGQATVSGFCEGRIVEAPRGSGGFGYDPLFEPLKTPGKTFGELGPAEKDALSHRGAALAQLDMLFKKAGF